MINFIVVDDNTKFLEIITDVITKVMMKNKFSYKVHTFIEYDASFMKVMNSFMSNKIYIMDIETRESSGIDVARKIRKKDVDSIIIFATVHNEAGLILLKDDLMFLTFLCKFDDFENKLTCAVKKALNYIHHKFCIEFNDRGSIYKIPIDDILYITKESNDRHSIIQTVYSQYRVNLSLKQLVVLCGDNIIQTHKSCFVNIDNVRVVDKKAGVIEFYNGLVIDMLSSMYKRGIDIGD